MLGLLGSGLKVFEGFEGAFEGLFACCMVQRWFYKKGVLKRAFNNRREKKNGDNG